MTNTKSMYEACGKNIKATLSDGKVFEGKCQYYTSALDNEPEMASISLAHGNGLVELFQNEIDGIEYI